MFGIVAATHWQRVQDRANAGSHGNVQSAAHKNVVISEQHCLLMRCRTCNRKFNTLPIG